MKRDDDFMPSTFAERSSASLARGCSVPQLYSLSLLATEYKSVAALTLVRAFAYSGDSVCHHPAP